MSLAAIRKALDDRLLAFQSTNVAWEGNDYEPQQGTPYLASHMSGVQRTQDGAAAKAVVLWTGFYRVTVWQPSGEGMIAASEKADAIVAHFPRLSSLITSQGHAVWLLSVTPLPAYQQPGWVAMPVIISWQSHEMP